MKIEPTTHQTKVVDQESETMNHQACVLPMIPISDIDRENRKAA